MSRKTGCTFLCLSLVALFGSLMAQAEEPWIEVRSPHFRVLTNGNKSDAREVAYEFEQMRYVFATQFAGFRLDSGAPLTIFAARDEKTAKELDPALRRNHGGMVAGKFLHGWEKSYALVRLDDTGLESQQIVYHEYTHYILHMNFHWLPTWLDEGLAEFYGNTRFEQAKIYIGAPTVRAGELQGTQIPIEDLISPEKTREILFHDEDQTQMFYAESWALVHYMNFAPGMDHGEKLNRFVGMIQQGEEQEEAFHEVFGDFRPMNKLFGQYMRSLAFHAGVLHSAPQIDKKNFTVTKLTLAQTDAELAGFHLWNHDLKDAAPLIEQALKEDPKLGLAHEEQGYLLFAQGQDARAKDEFSQAYALDGTLYLSLFAKTMLTYTDPSTPADEAALHEALLQVVKINPQFAPAFVQLAKCSLRQNNLPLAYGESRRAEELEPWRAGYHLMTGQILLRMGKDEEAAEAAKYVADHWYSTDHNEAVELWNAVPAAKRPKATEMVEEIPANTQTAEGIVRSQICGGPGSVWTLVLDDRGKELTFHNKGMIAGGFSDTAWWGEDHFSTCRHEEGMRAVVRYRVPFGATYAGDVVEVDFRDDLPGAKAEIAKK